MDFCALKFKPRPGKALTISNINHRNLHLRCCYDDSVCRNLCVPEDAATDSRPHPETPGAAAQSHLHHSSTSAVISSKASGQTREMLVILLVRITFVRRAGFFCSSRRLCLQTSNGASLRSSKNLYSNSAATPTT